MPKHVGYGKKVPSMKEMHKEMETSGSFGSMMGMGKSSKKKRKGKK